TAATRVSDVSCCRTRFDIIARRNPAEGSDVGRKMPKGMLSQLEDRHVERSGSISSVRRKQRRRPESATAATRTPNVIYRGVVFDITTSSIDRGLRRQPAPAGRNAVSAGRSTG